MNARITTLFAAALVGCHAMHAVAKPAAGLAVHTDAGALRIEFDGRPLAKYVFQDAAIPRPYFCDVHTLQGVQVTRNHPPRPGVDLTDHVELHPGIWLAFGDLGGFDSWRNKARVRHEGFAGTPRLLHDQLTFTAVNRYEAEGRDQCEERCAITIHVRDDAWYMDWRSTFVALEDGLYFGDQEEMGLGIRMATELCVNRTGKIQNRDGLVNEAGAWGKTSAACDYRGTSDGMPAGVTLTPGSDNFRPCWFHVRDYGLMAANPFGQNAFTKGPASRVPLERGQPLTLAYRLRFHSDAAPPFQQTLADEPPAIVSTALDRYVSRPDPEFAFRQMTSKPTAGSATAAAVTTHVLELTSQSWRSAAEVDRPTWKHWLTIVRPEKASGSTGFLYIGAGSNRDSAPTEPSPRVLALAQETNTVVAEINMVPNQPLNFTDSPDVARVEDDIIGYSRNKFMATQDETWLVRLAMVKSAVRAMDAVQQFCADPQGGGGGIQLTDFVVAGGSKRGWTTWLVGTVDPRVRAIVPLVIDALNSEQITRHHYQAYGFFSSALDDYVRHKIFPQKIGTPEYQAALAIEDPYHYRQRPALRMPKYMINAAGDEFFLPDNAQFYFHELPDEKHLRYVPNAKHSLAGSDARESLQAFYEAVLHNRPRLKYRWRKESDGALRIEAEDRPRAVRLWQATNPKARDFRLDTIGPAYVSSPLSETAPGVYLARVAPPAEGFTAFFAELEYDSGGRYPLKFTTEVSVVPDVLPFDFDAFQRKSREAGQ